MKLLDKLTQTKIYKFLLIHKKILIIVATIILIISGIIANNIDSSDSIKKVNAESEVKVIGQEFKINVSGEVRKKKTLVYDSPVYLFEIIDMCGGFSNYADVDSLDLLKVYNSDADININKNSVSKTNTIHIIDISNTSNNVLLYLGRINDQLNIYKVDKNAYLYEVLFKLDIDNCNYSDKVLNQNYSYIKKSAVELININTCSAIDLTKLDKIGPSTAEKIIEYRNEHGEFKTIEDIMNVKGIGEAIFSSIKDKICVG